MRFAAILASVSLLSCVAGAYNPRQIPGFPGADQQSAISGAESLCLEFGVTLAAESSAIAAGLSTAASGASITGSSAQGTGATSSTTAHYPSSLRSSIYTAAFHSKPPARQWTILASFFLTSSVTGLYKIVSLATGTKCLPADRLPVDGESLHDRQGHAEVLARRGAVRWFLEEIGRCQNAPNMTFQSEWISPCDDGRYELKTDVQLILYVSTVPCGDASMRFLATSQDEQMAALKDSAIRPPADPTLAARGRDNYALFGILRTKPGRADAPSTASMSCSDKIASWTFLGIQGALGSRFLRPLYIHGIIIGEVPPELQSVVRDDCERALWRRLEGILDCGEYSLHRPAIEFTALPFVHSRTSIPQVGGSCNDSLWWIADSSKPAEVLINGFKRGTAPKHRHREQSIPQACRKSMLLLYHENLRICGLPPEPDLPHQTIKQLIAEYQAAKQSLMGQQGIFSGWIRGSSTRFEAR
ncbi:tRNA-specific adenosine deaminase 1 [Mycena venus]|uniref:tRNA-specific adenosine deaminase 1 n=1 Tax=Mycena venus TaxID=2733690 RepID=A0A8H6WY67_9AGAR|nr:tRNA-specific adenosine deaminase 1 [Mycena venus]